MLIGVPKEIKNEEYRVGITPEGVKELSQFGHEVMIETTAGVGAGFSDSQYQAAGAKILSSAGEVFDQSEMIVKVKEPQPEECKMLSEGQVLFTYLHLAPDPQQAKLLLESRAIAIAYETVTDRNGGLPLLAPMSEVAGRLAVQAGAQQFRSCTGGERSFACRRPRCTSCKSHSHWWWCCRFEFSKNGYGVRC